MTLNRKGRTTELILATPILALALIATGCDSGGPDSTLPGQQDVTLAVSGKVTDFDSEEPEMNVTVKLEKGGCDFFTGECDYLTLASRQTDSNGQFAEMRTVTRCGTGFRLVLDPFPEGYYRVTWGIRCVPESQNVEMRLCSRTASRDSVWLHRSLGYLSIVSPCELDD